MKAEVINTILHFNEKLITLRQKVNNKRSQPNKVNESYTPLKAQKLDVR